MNHFDEILYINWYKCYYKNNLYLFEKLVNTIKKHNIKVKNDIYKYFNEFCALVYYNSSKRID